VVIVNVGHPEENDDLERALGETMADAFPEVLRNPIEPTNTLLVASEAPISAARMRRNQRGLPPGLRATAGEVAASLQPRLGGGEVFTDDRAPVEWLIDASLLSYAEE
jgi:hypothetical protein